MTSRAIRSFEAITPSSYLVLATGFAGAKDEAARRSAVDRAYYAAFLTVRDELAHKGYALFTRGPDAHVRVAAALNAIEEGMGERLISLRRARNRLTYQPGRQTLPRGQSLPNLLDSARVVIQAVRNLPARA
jgi:uncharacterized protein (UPF0332 family)